MRHNPELELNRVDYVGSVSLGELKALADFNVNTPQWLKPDTLALVLPGADFLSVDLGELDALFAHYRTIYQRMSFHIMRRSAWLCLSPVAMKHVGYWVGDRDTRTGMSSHVRLFETYADAGDWLLLQADELEQVKNTIGFDEIFRVEAPSRAIGR
ncbi:hypothetical protein U91I_02445 [alpha proteobacterium U9-1i]|nr:hypothetical protein U91I_02445 [alpha proteobacterium U9-1i]